MIDWAVIEKALFDWAVAGSGLPSNKVLWSRQNAPRPIDPFISLKIVSVTRVGMDWVDVVDNPASNGHDGEEIEMRARGQRELRFEMTCFGDVAVGNTSPVATLHTVMAKAVLPSRILSFNTAGMGLSRFDPLISTEGVIDSTVLEPRAILTTTFLLASEVAEFSTYIQHVVITDQNNGDVFHVPRS